MTVDKRLLREREKQRKSRPKFRRQESWRYKRVKTNWRKPIGIDNAMRHHKRGIPTIVRIGYRGPKAVRGLTRNGKEEVMVCNPQDLETINNDTQVARLSSTVGIKKKVDITNRADELGIKILNRPEEALTFATISEISEELLLEEDISSKADEAKPRKKKSTPSKGLTEKELAELDRIESELAKSAPKKKTTTTTKKPTTTPKKSTTTTKKPVTTKKPATTPKKSTTAKKTTTTKKSTTTTKKPTAKTSTAKKTTATKKSTTTTKKTAGTKAKK